MKIGIINYDNCNISSIFYSLYNLGANVEIIEQNQKLKNFSKIAPNEGGSLNMVSIFLPELEFCRIGRNGVGVRFE